MDRATKARIDSLLYELRSWVPGDAPKATIDELAGRFRLDPFVVKRLAHSEGWPLEDFTPVPEATPTPLPASNTEPIQLDVEPDEPDEPT